MTKRRIRYPDILARFSDGKDLPLMVKVMQLYFAIIAEKMAEGKRFGIPGFGWFYMAAFKKGPMEGNKFDEIKTGTAILKPGQIHSMEFDYFAAIQYLSNNNELNEKYNIKLIPKIWNPIFQKIQNRTIIPIPHVYKQSSIN